VLSCERRNETDISKKSSTRSRLLSQDGSTTIYSTASWRPNPGNRVWSILPFKFGKSLRGNSETSIRDSEVGRRTFRCLRRIRVCWILSTFPSKMKNLSKKEAIGLRIGNVTDSSFILQVTFK
jgi:hypothetical protein